MSQDHPLFPALCQLAAFAPAGRGVPIIAVTSPVSGVGSSHVCREIALLAARHYNAQGYRTALIDYDIGQQAQSAFFEAEQSQSEYGDFVGPFDLTFGQTPFWQVSPDVLGPDGQRLGASAYAGLFLIGQTGLAVSRFDWSHIREGQSVHMIDAPQYWNTLRDHFGCVVIDCPAMDRDDSQAALWPHVDATVLVTSPDQAGSPETRNAVRKLMAFGGTCGGIIINEGRKAAQTGPNSAIA